MASEFPFGMSLHATVHVAPEDVDDFFAALMAVYERAVSEPLCLSFEVYQKPEEPGRIRWIEDWDMSAEQFFLEQLSKDYYVPYLEATRHMFLEPYTYEFYERLAPEFSYTAKIGTLY